MIFFTLSGSLRTKNIRVVEWISHKDLESTQNRHSFLRIRDSRKLEWNPLCYKSKNFGIGEWGFSKSTLGHLTCCAGKYQHSVWSNDFEESQTSHPTKHFEACLNKSIPSYPSKVDRNSNNVKIFSFWVYKLLIELVDVKMVKETSAHLSHT